jgi:ADP-heptose:LPS heptosyltransferase
LGLVKHIEISFREFLVRALARLVRRRPKKAFSLEFTGGKVLFIRQDRIGDVLVSTPVFFSLAQHYPKMQMDICLSPKNAVAAEGLPFFRKCWVYEKSPLKAFSLIRSIRKEKYDVVVDLMDKTSATTTVFMILSNARWRIGLDKENAYALDVVVPLKSQSEVHIVERVAELLRPFGIDPDHEKLAISYMPSDRSVETVRTFLKERGLVEKKFIAVNISAGNETRFWGIENYRSLCATVAKELPDVRVLLLSKESDREGASAIGRGLGGVSLAPVLTFDQYAAAISLAGLLVTPDTAAVHLGAAFRIPSVVLFVQSDKKWRIWDAYKSPTENLVTEVDDLTRIPVEDVWNALKKLWDKRN